jgi:hypothetical protein
VIPRRKPLCAVEAIGATAAVKWSGDAGEHPLLSDIAVMKSLA